MASTANTVEHSNRPQLLDDEVLLVATRKQESAFSPSLEVAMLQGFCVPAGREGAQKDLQVGPEKMPGVERGLPIPVLVFSLRLVPTILLHTLLDVKLRVVRCSVDQIRDQFHPGLRPQASTFRFPFEVAKLILRDDPVLPVVLCR